MKYLQIQADSERDRLVVVDSAGHATSTAMRLQHTKLWRPWTAHIPAAAAVSIVVVDSPYHAKPAPMRV